MTKSPRAIFAQSGNDLDFVSEEVVAITTHILRDGNSDVAIRGLATPPIVANRVANGKPLVRRSGILHPMDLWGRPEAVEFSAPTIHRLSALLKNCFFVFLSEAKNPTSI